MKLDSYVNKHCEVVFKDNSIKTGVIRKVGNVIFINRDTQLFSKDIKKITLLNSHKNYKWLLSKPIEEHIRFKIREYNDGTRNELYEVSYIRRGHTIVRSFNTIEDAREFKKVCEDNIRLDKYKESMKSLNTSTSEELEYPETLLHSMGIEDTLPNYYTEIIPSFDDNFQRVRMYLTDREEEMLLLYYKNKLTFQELAKKYQLSRERVRQIILKSIKKLSSRNIKEVFLYNNSKMELIKSELYEQLKKEISYEIAVKIVEEHDKEMLLNNPGLKYEDMLIEELDLTVRSYRCLKRANINIIKELLELSNSELAAIKSLGKKSAKEIREKLAMLGLSLHEE